MGLSIRDIYKIYEGKPLLRGVSFDVAEGETVCLLGPSGSGKSTLLRIIAGLEEAENGHVLWDGSDLANVPVHQRHFGVMFQDYALFPHRRVAENVADLHSDNHKLSKENSLTEKGGIVNGRGDTPNMHDILTGSQLDGTAFPGEGDTTCGNWTKSGEGSAQVGHHDRQGGGQNPTSWNSAHASRGCSQQDLQGTGGNGLFYCFAIN